MSAITAAIRFLTVVPAPGGEWSARAASRSVAWFPAVGLGIGGAVAAVHWAARLAMPDLPAAALALAAGVVLTGALHLDGLADTFDGLLGGDTPKRRLEIMKDPSIGVFGVAAVVLVLIAKWGGLSSLPDAYGWAAIAVAAMSGRFAAVASMAIFRYERSQGLGSPFVGASRVAYLAAAVFAAALAFVLAGPFGLAALACATVIGLAVSAFAARQLNGGCNRGCIRCGNRTGGGLGIACIRCDVQRRTRRQSGLERLDVWRALLTLGLAVIWDRFLGEPPEKIHPVVWMGRAVDVVGEPTGDKETDLRRGLIAATILPLASVAVAAVAGRILNRMGPIPAIVGGAFLLKSMFAIRGMTNESAMVDQDLAAGSSEAARASLSRIVSRDVSDLNDSEIASATISSVAENVTDSVVGPLVAYGAFGLPGAAAYRAIDTIDSMIGYRGKYEHLGAAAARLDDAASFVPARLAGGAVVAAASALPGYDAPASAQTMIEQHGRTESPNGGWPIGAMAGALGVEVEKTGHYKLGPEGKRPAAQRHWPGQPLVCRRGPRGYEASPLD